MFSIAFSMINIGLLPELTKTYILNEITEEQIMEKYLGISVDNSTLEANSVCSPLRSDKDPTCNYWYSKTEKLRFRDWSGHFHGDCYDVVAFRLNVNSRDKRAFQFILHTIAKDFRIHRYQDSKEVQKYDKLTETFRKKKRSPNKTIIKVVPRKWNYRDDSYWGRYHINKDLLGIGHVYPVEELYISKRNKPFIRIYSYNVKDPAYAYYGGRDKNNNPKWKVYFPLRRGEKVHRNNPRFLVSHSFLQGKHLITPARFCVVTKSMKDVLAFRAFNIVAVAPPAESVLLTIEEYDYIRPYFDFIVSCMDYDRAGKLMAKQLKRVYNIDPIMLTDGHFGTHDYGSKDPSDFIAANGYDKSMELFQSVYNRYAEDIKKFDTYYFNKLKHI